MTCLNGKCDNTMEVLSKSWLLVLLFVHIFQ